MRATKDGYYAVYLNTEKPETISKELSTELLMGIDFVVKGKTIGVKVTDDGVEVYTSNGRLVVYPHTANQIHLMVGDL